MRLLLSDPLGLEIAPFFGDVIGIGHTAHDV
jgi:hypothetical protein